MSEINFWLFQGDLEPSPFTPKKSDLPISKVLRLVEHLVFGTAMARSLGPLQKQKNQPLVNLSLIYEQMTRAMDGGFVVINGLFKKRGFPRTLYREENIGPRGENAD